MAHSTLAVLSSPDFSQVLRQAIDRAVSRNFDQIWPKSIEEDQAAIEQARAELGPNADPRLILSRASEIKKDREPNSLIWRIAVKS
jgi:hypothetical protein